MKFIPFSRGEFVLNQNPDSFKALLKEMYPTADILEDSLSVEIWKNPRFAIRIIKNSFQLWKIKISLPIRFVFANLNVRFQEKEGKLVGVYNVRFHLLANVTTAITTLSAVYFLVKYFRESDTGILYLSLAFFAYYFLLLQTYNDQLKMLMKELEKIKALANKRQE